MEGLGIEETLKLTCKSLMDVVESGGKNIELVVLTDQELRVLSEEEVEKLATSLE